MPTKSGFYANINVKQTRIQAGSGETMNHADGKGTPTANYFHDSAKTAKKK